MKIRSRKLGILPLLVLAVMLIAAASYAGEKAWLGVVLQPLTIDLKEAMDVDRDLGGVLISDVMDDSPADRCGLEEGDIIIEIGGKEIHTVSAATRRIRSYSPGDQVDILVMREGDQRKSVEVTLGEADDYEADDFDFDFDFDFDRGLGKIFTQRGYDDGGGYLGVRIEGISSDLGDYFGVDAGEGVLVVEVIDGSAAEKAGIKEGDVILKFDGKEVDDVDQLIKYVRRADPGEEVELTIKRKRRTHDIEVELGGIGGNRMHRIQNIKIPRKIKIDKMDDPEGMRYRIYRPDKGNLDEELEELKEELEELREELEELRES